MPQKPPRPCSHPGCPELVTDGSRCDAHRKDQQKQKTAQRMTVERVREDKRFYDSSLWRSFRAAVMRKEPWCRECRRNGRMTLADELDHIDRISQGGARLSERNTQPLCRSCHSRKRQKESMEARC